MHTPKWVRKGIVSLGLLGVAALLGSGCALSKETVALQYSSPAQNVTPVAGADAVPISVEITDARSDKTKVSCKKNGYGMEMAPIMSKTDVSALVTEALTTELHRRGFKTEGGKVQVQVTLTKFYNDFKIGMWSGSAVSEVALNVSVKKPDGNISFTKPVTGASTLKGIQMCSGKNAKASLEAALQDAVTQLMNDTAFTTALVQGGA